MRFLKSLSLIGAAALAVAACQEEPYTPAEPESGTLYYFPSTVKTSITLTSETTSLDIDLYRIETAGTASVSVSVSEESGVIVPERQKTVDVSFADGSKTASLSLPVDMEQIEYGDEFKVALKLLGETSRYGASEVVLSVAFPEPWVSLGEATYVDDFVTTFFGVDNEPYKVEIQENQVRPGFYRLVNPYGEAYPYNDPGDWDESKDYYIEIHAEDPTAVYLDTPQHVGCDWGYGEFIVGSLAGYYIARGQTLEEVKANGYTGTLENGVITFPAEVLLFAMSDYNDGGLYTSNVNGAFAVAMPGVVLADYSSEVEYVGQFTDKDGEDYAVVEVTLGADVEEAKIAIAPGDDPEDALALILADDASVVSIDASGEVKVAIPALGDVFTIVVVPVGDGVLQEGKASYDIFEYKDLSISVAVADPETNADEITGTVKATVDFGADVEYARVAILPGKEVTDECIDAFLADEESLTKVEETGTTVSFDLPEEGTYVIVAYSYAYGEAWNLSSKTFDFVLVPEVWETVGTATWTDAFVGPAYGAESLSYEVELQESQDTPGRYRLVNVYGEAFPYNDPGDWDDSKDYYLVINADDPDYVWIEFFDSGCGWGDGNFRIASDAGIWVYEDGMSIEEVKDMAEEEEIVFGTMKDNVITFPPYGIWLSEANYENGRWYMTNKEPYTITFNFGESAAVAARKAVQKAAVKPTQKKAFAPLRPAKRQRTLVCLGSSKTAAKQMKAFTEPAQPIR